MVGGLRLQLLGMPTVQAGMKGGGKQTQAQIVSQPLCLTLSAVMLFAGLQAGLQAPGEWALGVPKKATASKMAAGKDERLEQASKCPCASPP